MPDTTEFFLDEGLIHKILRPLKQGKEASVHLCEADRDKTGHDLAALKIYRPLDRRDFRDESIYREGEWIKDGRVRRALENKTRFGRVLQAETWVHREWETIQKLSQARVAPLPIALHDDAILMTFVGDARRAAPQLRDLHPTVEELEALWRQLRADLGQMLLSDVVHADLSAYNVLVWNGKPTVIDFPQSVDPKVNRHAEDLLRRDIQRLGDWFTRQGLDLDWEKIADEIWFAWLHADLIPADYQL
jgi:RIO kinase 1